MGYYTMIEVNIRIKKDKVNAFRKAKQKLTTDDLKWFAYFDDISIKEDRNVEFDEYSRKWYEADNFYDFIKDFVEKGYIEGQGEDFGDYWRIAFDGKGNWKRQIAQFDEAE
ncbi:hypothetical protein ACFL54_09045 [Planctomycetota bacterium]